MEGVASGMAVASLSLQLVQSINTIRKFIRDVKGAPKELQRLTALLDRLHALLETIHDMLGRQTSFQGQHFPAPLPIISDSLESCKLSLKPLCLIVEDYAAGRHGKSSSLTRLKDDIKVGLKTKSIAGFEEQIQHEINYLSTALSANLMSISMSTMHISLQNQQICTTMYSHIVPSQAPAAQAQLSSLADPVVQQTYTSSLPRLKSQYWTSYMLQRFGIYQRGTVQYTKGKGSQAPMSLESTDRIISTSREILLTCGFLSYGVRWTKQYPHGGIFSSLSVYPIVPDLGKHEKLIKTASINEIQQTFHSGALHPFTRDVYGQTLFELAAMYCRADVYRLLLHHGVKPEPSYRQMSPLSLVVWEPWDSTLRRWELETLRLLLAYESEQFEYSVFISTSRCSLDTIEWLWHNVACVLQDEDVIKFRSSLLVLVVQRFSLPNILVDDEKLVERTAKLLDIEMKEHYLCGGVRLMEPLFDSTDSSIESREIGSLFIDLLSSLGFDIQACMKTELDYFSHLDDADGQRKIIFESDSSGGWSLRWEWVFDSSCPGYLLASEHIALGADARWVDEWPFGQGEHSLLPWADDDEEWEQQNLRAFERRMSNKARKERAKAKRKRGIKVPGAWV